jgi:ketosteroid isomerase-like protein
MFGSLALITLLATSALAQAAEAPKLTAETLIDRAMIEDLIIDYYAQLGSGKHDFSYWFAPDGVLDVNGEVGKGKAGIEKIYKDTAARSEGRKGTFKMLLTNLRITVNGNTATVRYRQIYNSDRLTVDSRKTLIFVKQGNRWLIKQERSGG